MSDEISNKNIDFDIKFAHGEGHTILDINEKHNKILTGGSDGEVRCWSINDLDDDAESFDVGSTIYCLFNSSENFYVASDSIDIKYYSIEDGSYKGSIVRSTLNMYSVCLSFDNKSLACGGGDFIIKVVDLENFSVKQLEGHQAPILSLNFDPKNKYLASSSCDGSFKIWNLKDFTNVLTLEKLHDKSNDFLNSKTLCFFSWNSTGSLIAIPSQKSLLIYERDTWLLKHEIKYPNFESISICVFNKTSNFLAASNTEGILIIWDLNSIDEPIAFYVNDNKTTITSLKFDYSSDKLYACDKNGQLIVLNIYQETKTKNTNTIKDDKYNMVEDFDSFENEDDFFKNFDEKKLRDPEKNLQKVPVIEESQESFLQQEESQTMSLLDSQQVVDKNEMNIQIDASIFDQDLNDEDEELIDIGALKQKYESKINESFSLESKDKVEEDVDEKPKETHVKIKPIMQPAFKPGSTPAHLENRFMVWNSVGIVTCSKTENDNIIDVEFHNSEVYRPIHMPNTYSYTMADLTIDTLVLASPFYETDNEESSTPSTFFCMNFSSWDNNKEWKYQMPDSESIEAITASQSFAIVSTDLRRIRLFTLSGIQLHLFSIPGPVVCLVSQENLLSIVYHDGSGLPGEESLSMNILKLNDKSIHPLTQLTTSSIAIALNPKSVIDWFGFTDEGNVCVVDSSGFVKIFNQITRCWIPVANLKSKNKNDNYFVISVSEIQEKIKCVSCKGSKYPSTIPKPDLLSVQFEIPLCEITTTKSKLEEQLIRINLRNNLLEKLSLNGFDVEFSNEENNKKQVEILIKLFALAINADCNSLALEIAELLPNQLAIEGAIRYATQKNKNLIVNKLNKLIRDKFNFHEQLEETTNTGRLNKFSKKRNVSVDENDVLKPKMIKLTNENNPFKTS